MKTRGLLTLSCFLASGLVACASDDFCDKVDCEATGGGAGATEATTGTAQGPGSTASTSSSQPTSSSGGGGDGGSSVSSNVGPGGGGDGGSGAGGDGQGGSPPQCIPTEGVQIEDDTCAVFVNGDYDGATEAGTLAQPFKTLGDAVAAALDRGVPIYACLAAVPYTEEVQLDDSVALVGGFGCGTWAWHEDDRTQLTSPEDTIPLKITDGAQVSISNFAITAQDASGTVAGGSSIAVLVDSSEIELIRSDLAAGNAADGAPGVFVPRADPAPDGLDGNDGCSNGNTGLAVEGGANTCGGLDRSGGLSGQGTTTANGGPGSPGNPEEPGVNIGGARQVTGPPASSCGIGGQGSAGTSGDAGTGADEVGTLDASGFTPADGNLGEGGTPGFGGGGGGGAHVCLNGLVGPSGGGGGAGGCGGAPGAVGRGGGASIALALAGSTVTFQDVVLSVGDGGRGGNGAAGQPGQFGGEGGDRGDVVPAGQGATACAGGPGGDGGNGGPGGGGRGGHSVGIAYTGAAPSDEGMTFAGGGDAGAGGERSDLALEGKGFDGVAEAMLAVD